jgi:hypothetical protein
MILKNVIHAKIQIIKNASHKVINKIIAIQLTD